MADVRAFDVVPANVLEPHADLLERAHRAGLEPVDELLVAREVGADPCHRVIHGLGVDRRTHQASSVSDR